ncbi:MAG: putative quinol monooxygenase [Pirellulales bacterium]
MLYLNVLLTVTNPADVESVKGLLIEQGNHSRQEPGCARFEVYHSTADPAKFLLVERWESQQAVDAHRQAYAYTQIYQPKVLPLVTREGHPSSLL